MKSKKAVILINSLLILWFFLDMIGMPDLVSASWNQGDGVWFLIFLIIFLLFCWRDKIGKVVMTIFLTVWLIIEFMSHEFYTIFGTNKSSVAHYNHFFDTIHLIPASSNVIVPDAYHIILHLLIVAALITSILYWIKDKNKG